jgi:hypothetical protein
MENIKWIFDGIGTTIITSIISLLIGGGIGYKIAIKKTVIKQTQKAGDNSNQIQIGNLR